jgi:hypothetical protein
MKSFYLILRSFLFSFSAAKKRRNFIREVKRIHKKNIKLSNFFLVNVANFMDPLDYIFQKMEIEYVPISSYFHGRGGVNGWNNTSEAVNSIK